MTFATITQSGIFKTVTEQGNKVLAELEVETGKLPVLVEVYGKSKETALQLQGKPAIVSGKLEVVNRTFTINADSISPATAETQVSHITICGRLGTDPNIKVLGSGQTLAKVGLAVNGYRNGEKTTSWFNITAWAKQAELIGDYQTKGSILGASGRLNINEFTKKDGTQNISHEVTVTGCFFMPKSMKDSGGQTRATTATVATTPTFDEVAF